MINFAILIDSEELPPPESKHKYFLPFEESNFFKSSTPAGLIMPWYKLTSIHFSIGVDFELHASAGEMDGLPKAE